MLYRTQPLDFVSDFDVVNLYLENNSEILLLHRLPHKSQGGKWGVPAGKVDVGENLDIALTREVFEETGVGIDTKEAKWFRSMYVKHPEHSLIYHMYHLELPIKPAIILSSKEHQAFQWVSPTNALAMNLVDDLDTCINMFYFTEKDMHQSKN